MNTVRSLTNADVQAIGDHLLARGLSLLAGFFGNAEPVMKEVEAKVIKFPKVKIDKRMRKFLTFIQNVSDGDAGVPRRVACASLGVTPGKWNDLRVAARDAGYIKKISPTSRGTARWILTDDGRKALAS